MKAMKDKDKPEAISVCVRVRPLNVKEQKKCKVAWKVEGNSITQMMMGGGKGGGGGFVLCI